MQPRKRSNALRVKNDKTNEYFFVIFLCFSPAFHYLCETKGKERSVMPYKQIKYLVVALSLLLLLSPAVSLRSAGQSFSSLWKEAYGYETADMPESELSVLQRIEEKAAKEKEYGHLLKSSLMRIAVAGGKNPGEFPALVGEYESRASAAGDEALRAAYYSTIGHIYGNYDKGGARLNVSFEESKAKSAEYYSKALSNPALLAATKAKSFEPFAETGNAAYVFNGDLLHLIALEAENYQLMADYYSAAGNRPAACIASLYKLRSERKADLPEKAYLARLDSLAHEYADVPAAGEVAIERFGVMDASGDASAEEKVEYIDNALVEWGSWERMSVLRNARRRITLPSFHAVVSQTQTIPNKEIPVYLTSVKNLQGITMSVYRVNITGDEQYDPNKADDYKALSAWKEDKPVQESSRVWYGMPEYDEIRDTLVIAPLPAGVYMAEFTATGGNIPAERVMINITDLRVLAIGLDDNRMRLVSVNATTGAAVPYADVHIKTGRYDSVTRKYEEEETTLATEDDGELVISSQVSGKYRVTTAGDKAFRWENISRNIAPSRQEEKRDTLMNVFTDRKVYRPGQTVEMSALLYETYTKEHWETMENEELTLSLFDANNDLTEEKQAATDSWGTAAASFLLPANAPAGYYRLRAAKGRKSAYAYFRVEEYKRPTFAVDIDDYNEPYKEDDTITVCGAAKTYSGVPVGNAKVKYKVKTGDFSWWRTPSPLADVIGSGETATESDGTFRVRVPVKFPSDTKKGNRFARVILSVDVTSAAGETHSAESVYPVSDRATLLDLCGFEEKQCREYAKPFSFVYVNGGGNAIADDVTYTVDGENPVTLPAHTEASLPLERLSSGQHLLKAVCRNDTIEKKFVVFSLTDNAVPADTAAWFYSTCGEQKNYQMKEGQAEYVQFGTNQTNQTVYYAVVSANGLLESGQMTLNNEVVCRKIDYKEEWGDGIALRYMWVSGGELYSYGVSLSRPVKDCSLETKLDTFRDFLTPGEEEEWTVTVKKPDGTPAEAQVMAVLYDKALDAICGHAWRLVHSPRYASPVINQNAAYSPGTKRLYGEQTIRYAAVPDLTFWHFVFPSVFSGSGICYASSAGRAYAPLSTALASKAMPASRAAEGGELVSTADADGGTAEGDVADVADVSDVSENVPVRENLSETAFFMPRITTDKNGNAKIKFTLPESITTWRFMSVAHDKEMNVGTAESEMTARKTLMIQPNMPRFIREGDKARLSATVFNTSGETLAVETTMEIINPETGQTVYKESGQCKVKAEDSSSVSFDLPSGQGSKQSLSAERQALLTENVYICRLTAKADNVSDGEQHYLPVLSNNVETVSTRAFTQTQPGEKTVDLAPLYADSSFDETLTAEYTDNPAWLMIDALPDISAPDADNAISLAAALYAGSITEKIMQKLPDGVFKEKQSALSLGETADKLAALQNADGSFSWFGGMSPSDYVTVSVAEILARGEKAGLSATYGNVLSKAMNSLDNTVADYIKRLKEREKNNEETAVSELALRYLYIQSIRGEDITGTARDNAEYLLSKIKGHSADWTIYGKANIALISATHPVAQDRKEALLLLESIRQYCLQDEEKGCYFDAFAAPYSWRNNKIPTQCAVIEAFQTLAPGEKEMINGLQQWLLQEKRAVGWDSPMSSADAVYAFFGGWNDFESGALDAAASPEKLAAAKLYVDGKEIKRDAELSGKGYASAVLQGRFSQFTAKKTTANTSWGAVYVRCMQPLEDVTSDGEELSIRREVLDEDGKAMNDYPVTGQKIKVRITVEAKRDLDFVEIVDNRPACLEPANPLSGYYGGAYTSVLDNKTVYYYDKFGKGTHVAETEYYVDRAGNYRAGIATVKCEYAPEYQARAESYVMEIK